MFNRIYTCHYCTLHGFFTMTMGCHFKAIVFCGFNNGFYFSFCELRIFSAFSNTQNTT